MSPAGVGVRPSRRATLPARAAATRPVAGHASVQQPVGLREPQVHLVHAALADRPVEAPDHDVTDVGIPAAARGARRTPPRRVAPGLRRRRQSRPPRAASVTRSNAASTTVTKSLSTTTRSLPSLGQHVARVQIPVHDVGGGEAPRDRALAPRSSTRVDQAGGAGVVVVEGLVQAVAVAADGQRLEQVFRPGAGTDRREPMRRSCSARISSVSGTVSRVGGASGQESLQHEEVAPGSRPKRCSGTGQPTPPSNRVSPTASRPGRRGPTDPAPT